MRQSTQTALAVLAVIALAGAFWLLLLAPKREKANELSEQTSTLSAAVASEQAKVTEAVTAKEQFPNYYRQLVLLGKAVPADAATPSLLVQLNGISRQAQTLFKTISLGAGGEEGGNGEVSEGPGAMLPIGASVGAAGLPAMPYLLEFQGGFFGIADFIEGLDSLVETENGEVIANGRLVTIDGFTMSPPPEGGSTSNQALTASFQVTTYVTPPDQGLTAGATSSGPETELAESP
jgi:Tfp pilus assembly protein PilO